MSSQWFKIRECLFLQQHVSDVFHESDNLSDCRKNVIAIIFIPDIYRSVTSVRYSDVFWIYSNITTDNNR